MCEDREAGHYSQKHGGGTHRELELANRPEVLQQDTGDTSNGMRDLEGPAGIGREKADRSQGISS